METCRNPSGLPQGPRGGNCPIWKSGKKNRGLIMSSIQKEAPAATEAKRLDIEQWQYTPYQIDALELGYKPRTVNLEKVRESVPHDLQQVDQFVVWQYQPNLGKDKPKKMPLRHNGVGFTNGSSTDKAS